MALRAIPKQTPLDQRQLVEPNRKIRKAIRKLPTFPAPEGVHALRTQSRRLGAIVYALKLDGTKRASRLPRSLNLPSQGFSGVGIEVSPILNPPY